MRPLLELDLGPMGHGLVKLDGVELPFTTAVRFEASVREPTKVAIETTGAAAVMKATHVELTRETIEGLEAICAAWRDERDELPYSAIKYDRAVAESLFILLHEAAQGRGRVAITYGSDQSVMVTMTETHIAPTFSGSGGDLETALDALNRRRRP